MRLDLAVHHGLEFVVLALELVYSISLFEPCLAIPGKLLVLQLHECFEVRRRFLLLFDEVDFGLFKLRKKKRPLSKGQEVRA